MKCSTSSVITALLINRLKSILSPRLLLGAIKCERVALVLLAPNGLLGGLLDGRPKDLRGPRLFDFLVSIVFI